MNTRKHSNCPIAQVAILLSDPWTMLIIRDLLKKEMRFSELEKSLVGISTRTLTNKIKNLEAEGVIVKKGLFYVITSSGKKLEKVLDAMSFYGKSLKNK